MAKRGASSACYDITQTSSNIDTTLAGVSTSLSGIYTLTDPVYIEVVIYPIYHGCVECRSKIDTGCSFHPGSLPKAYYRLRAL